MSRTELGQLDEAWAGFGQVWAKAGQNSAGVGQMWDAFG